MRHLSKKASRLSLLFLSFAALFGLFQNCSRDGALKVSEPVSEALRPSALEITTENYYEWAMSDWSTCSASCNGGLQTRILSCRDGEDQEVSLEQCSIESRPTDSQACNVQACDADPTPEKPQENRLVKQQVEVKVNNKVDILVVMDNSASMKSEMKSMSQRFSNFLRPLNGLNWQLGIITMDNKPTSGKNVRTNGRLIPLVGPNNEYILKSSLEISQAETVFANTIQMPTNGSSEEVGLATTVSALNRALTPGVENKANQDLIRSDAGLAVIVVSDSWDTSATTAQDVLKLVNEQFPGKAFSFHSIAVPEKSIVNGVDTCKTYREGKIAHGGKYYELSELTGGVQGTVCTNDFGSQLSQMGAVTKDLVTSITLECASIDTNTDGIIDNADIRITKSTGQILMDFTLSQMKVNFIEALPAGQIEIAYYCQ